jgi:hypothetical protein
MYHKNPATFNYSRLKAMVNIIISAVCISIAPNNYECIWTLFYSIDASDSERLGKYVNYAPKKNANCVAKSVFVCGIPHVLLFAAKDIPANMELRYDYRGKKQPWRDLVMVTASEVNVPQKGDENCLSAGKSGNAFCQNLGDGDSLGFTKSSRTCRIVTSRHSELFQDKLQKNDGNSNRSRMSGKQKRHKRLTDYTANADAFEHSMQKITCMDSPSAKVTDSMQHETVEAIDDMASDDVKQQECSSDTCCQNTMGPELPVMSASEVFVLKTNGYMETGDEPCDSVDVLSNTNMEVVLQQGSIIDAYRQNTDSSELLITPATETIELHTDGNKKTASAEVVGDKQSENIGALDSSNTNLTLQQGSIIDACSQNYEGSELLVTSAAEANTLQNDDNKVSVSAEFAGIQELSQRLELLKDESQRSVGNGHVRLPGKSRRHAEHKRLAECTENAALSDALHEIDQSSQKPRNTRCFKGHARLDGSIETNLTVQVYLQQANSNGAVCRINDGSELPIMSGEEVNVAKRAGDGWQFESDDAVDDSDKDPDYVPCSRSESESSDFTWDLGFDALVTEGRSGVHGTRRLLTPTRDLGERAGMKVTERVHMVQLPCAITVPENARPCHKSALSENVLLAADTVQEMSESSDNRSHGSVSSGIDCVDNAAEITAVQTKHSDRPARPCPLCGAFKVRLTRHIKTVHKNEATVEKCLSQNLTEQRAVFKQLKRTGIMKHNMKIIGQKDVILQRERKCKHQGSAVVCDSCSGVFNRRWFSAHRRQCGGNQSALPRPVNASVFFSSLKVSEVFKTEVLSKFTNDEVGRLCQQNETIIMIGYKLYLKVKARKDKKVEVKRSVMADMRRLGHVYSHFRHIAQQHNDNTSAANFSVSVLDMFRRQYFSILEEACAAYTAADECSNGKDKYGLQLALYYLLVKAAKIVKVFYLVKNDSIKSTETSEFLDVLNFSKDTMIGGAIYNTNKNRNTKLRRVDNLPHSTDVSKLKAHMCSRMQQLLHDKFLLWSANEYVELRDLACARLTLFNARRGGEPARLLVSDWTDACSKIWFDKNRVQAMPPEEKKLMDKSFVMYQTGKGVNHLVPVIVPEDTVQALKKLTDATLRSQCGVNPDNLYLFPSTVSSESNVSGWHALSRACSAAGIKERKITATKMRHLASTMYASLEIPEAKRAAFYTHMGHSKAVNLAIYQAPLAEQEVLEVGTILHQFGKALYVSSKFLYYVMKHYWKFCLWYFRRQLFAPF